MQLTLSRFLICAFLVLLSGDALAQKQGEALTFDPFPRGQNADIVEKIWMTVPAYRHEFDVIDTLPEYMIASADLDKDGRAEIFARHSNGESNYCVAGGVTCLMHIYTIKNGLAQQIGKFQAGAEVIPLDTTQNGYADLLVMNDKDSLDLYRFNGTTYEKGTSN